LRSADGNRDYPLVLTSFRHVQFVSDEHRNIPRLRNEVREPLIEIHPETAAGLMIGDGDWVNVETVVGKVRLRAKYSDSLHPKVVCAPYDATIGTLQFQAIETAARSSGSFGSRVRAAAPCLMSRHVSATDFD
jgi:anaerobic selenocysteine-containing dehydrogenase